MSNCSAKVSFLTTVHSICEDQTTQQATVMHNFHYINNAIMKQKKIMTIASNRLISEL